MVEPECQRIEDSVVSDFHVRMDLALLLAYYDPTLSLLYLYSYVTFPLLRSAALDLALPIVFPPLLSALLFLMGVHTRFRVVAFGAHGSMY